MMYIGWIELLMLLLMAALFLLLVGGTIALVVWLVRRGSAGQPDGGDSALRLLRERYARGELSREEYEQMRDDLRD